ncbi:TPA: glucose-6-phosphate isomerase, partial [Haemophilus influenzae]
EVVIVHKYDSTLVVGACVLVSDNGNTKNISTFSPRNPL